MFGLYPRERNSQSRSPICREIVSVREMFPVLATTTNSHRQLGLATDQMLEGRRVVTLDEGAWRMAARGQLAVTAKSNSQTLTRTPCSCAVRIRNLAMASRRRSIPMHRPWVTRPRIHSKLVRDRDKRSRNSSASPSEKLSKLLRLAWAPPMPLPRYTD